MKLDNQGRIVLPREWREKFGNEMVIVTLRQPLSNILNQSPHK
nr:AbrB/MazE/SpoVT family DNA-binding domain-containing protein [Candidatus Freyarchaeota archaeon]